MPDKEQQYSRSIIMLMALSVAIFISFLYFDGKLDSAEFFTLDYRFLANRLLSDKRSNNVFQREVPAVGAEEKKELSDTEQGSVNNIIFIDMPPCARDDDYTLALKDCATAIKIFTAWRAKAIVIAAPLQRFSDPDSLEELEKNMSLSGSVYYAPEESQPKLAGGKIGHLAASFAVDGRLHKVPVISNIDGRGLYQLGLKAAIDAISVTSGVETLDLETHVFTLKTYFDMVMTIPLDNDNRFIINWAPRSGEHLRRTSFKNVIESYKLIQYGASPLIDPGFFRGSICVLGTAVSNNIPNRAPFVRMNRATSAACGLIAAGIINRDFVREVPKIIGGIIIFMSTLMFGMAIVNFKLLRLITIAVIALIFFIALSLFQVSRETAFIIVILLSVPIGIFFANSHVFSGLVLTILVLTGYCMASFSILKTNGIIMPTFSPAIAITLTFVLFYCYTRIKHYMGKMHMINLASRDGLTGLMNRRYFNAIIDSEFDGIASHRFKKLSLVMCDIDDFKKLNDTFGHQAGDEVLRRVAKVMKSKCRATDIIARYGGEEFVFVFPGAGIEEISGLVEEIRQSVERETFNFKKQMRSVTISMGLAQYFRGMKKEELIEKADQALYRAKKEGKNRVCI